MAAILGAPANLETLRAGQLDASAAAVAIDLPAGLPLLEDRSGELAALDTGGPLQVLTGMGGIGKTVLAARWARHHCEEIRVPTSGGGSRRLTAQRWPELWPLGIARSPRAARAGIRRQTHAVWSPGWVTARSRWLVVDT